MVRSFSVMLWMSSVGDRHVHSNVIRHVLLDIAQEAGADD